MPIPLHTPRLVLRYLAPADAETLFAYRSDPAVAVMQGWAPASRSEADAFIARLAQIPFASPGTWSQVGIVEAQSDLLIGDFGAHVDAAGDAGEIGYTIAPAFHRRGYATEAITAALAELAGLHGIRHFIARVAPGNIPSIALLTRLGFVEDGAIGEDVRFVRRSPMSNLKKI